MSVNASAHPYLSDYTSVDTHSGGLCCGSIVDPTYEVIALTRVLTVTWVLTALTGISLCSMHLSLLAFQDCCPYHTAVARHGRKMKQVPYTSEEVVPRKPRFGQSEFSSNWRRPSAHAMLSASSEDSSSTDAKEVNQHLSSARNYDELYSACLSLRGSPTRTSRCAGRTSLDLVCLDWVSWTVYQQRRDGTTCGHILAHAYT